MKIADKDPGDHVALEIRRNGERRELEAQLVGRQQAFQYQAGRDTTGRSRDGYAQRARFDSDPSRQLGQQGDFGRQIQELRHQVAQLRHEVQQLRQERG